VKEISLGRTATCDLADFDIVFPDGTMLEVPEIGGTGSIYSIKSHKVSDTYTLINLGTYGVVAIETTADGKSSQWWGKPVGVAKVKAQYHNKGPVVSR
jgi:hypothetical protein